MDSSIVFIICISTKESARRAEQHNILRISDVLTFSVLKKA